jgi:hypothetical protein
VLYIYFAKLIFAKLICVAELIFAKLIFAELICVAELIFAKLICVAELIFAKLFCETKLSCETNCETKEAAISRRKIQNSGPSALQAA